MMSDFPLFDQTVHFCLIHFPTAPEQLLKRLSLRPIGDRQILLQQVLQVAVRSHAQPLGACNEFRSLLFAEAANLEGCLSCRHEGSPSIVKLIIARQITTKKRARSANCPSVG